MKGIKFLVFVVLMLGLVVPVSAGVAGSSPGGAVAAAPGLSASVPILADWYENWDSYPTGQSMHGIGGWKGWGNDPNATAYTSDAEAISSPNSIDINGASDLVHEYDIDDGVWTYTAWQYVPTGFADESYFILLNQYDDAGVTTNWSTQVRFDGNDGLAVFQGYYDDLAQLPLITGQWVELRVEIDLVNDWQQFYYGGDLLYEASWTEGIGSPTPGITSIGGVDLYANLASAVYYDDLSLVEVGGEMTMHVGGIEGHVMPNPMGDPTLLMFVLAEDEAGAPLAEVMVDATIMVPGHDDAARTRYTHLSGWARFWAPALWVGNYQICVDNLTLEGYTYNPDDNVVTCMDWNLEPPPGP